MHCPMCGAEDTKVVDSRLAEAGDAVRRRRRCGGCSYRFTTFERVDAVALVVIKSNGSRQPFERAKLTAGIEAACKGRGLSADDLENLGDQVEDVLRTQAAGSEAGAVSSATIGLAVLERLRVLDDVAYLRFASVYKNFDAASDFHRELELLDKLSAESSSD